MKILIIARGIPNSHDPQEGCFEWDQAKALAERGHTVVVMAVDSRVRKYWRKIGINAIKKNGITGYKIFYFPTSIIRRIFSLKTGYKIEALLAKKLYRYIIARHGEFDIIHSHYLNCTYYGVHIKNIYNCNLIATEHWSKVKMHPMSKEIQFLGTFSYKIVDRLIVVSEMLKDTIYQNFGINSTVIHNLIDVTNLKPALKQTHNNDYTVLAVGSLNRIKGYDILIKSFAKSDLKSKNSIVKIIGKGAELKNLKAIAKENNVSDNIIFCGQKSKEEVYQELRNADLFVLSSRSENFSVALIEATANGVPAIATLCGGVKEYPIKDVTKIPVENIDAMSKALNKCFDNRNNVNRDTIQRDTLKYFSPDAIVRQLESVYNEVLSNNQNHV